MAPRTLADYGSKTRNWINPLLGKHRLDRLTPEHPDTAYATMFRRGLSPSTVLKSIGYFLAPCGLRSGVAGSHAMSLPWSMLLQPLYARSSR